MNVAVKISSRDYDAVLFDLDGVLTMTASVHAAAWKTLFDGFLEQRATKAGTPFVPFDIATDYPRYVDGKPRYDGVADFLESRGIELPSGEPEDGPYVQSVRALGNLKDRYFLERLEQHGVEPYEPALALVRALRAQEIKTAVVSSSNHCAVVLEAAGIAELFDARVDGLDLTRLELDGKPAPDAFLEAARRIGVVPSRAVVVEDAIAGVAAGRAGGFGWVIGVDRRGQAQSLRDAGVDVVITAQAQVQVAAEPSAAWSLVYEDFDVAKEITRSLLMYRYRRLGEARAAAERAVFKGAMFPWQSASDGQEETQAFNLNPRSARWVRDNSYLQRHVGSAIAHNVWQYFQVTRDVELMKFYGAELILDIARFWSSIATFNDERGRYEIRGVMGPDAFHDAYPDSATPGINNNAYIDIMAVWVLCRALEVLELLSDMRRAELTTRLGISAEEIARWSEMSRRMVVPFHGDGIISQFEGYDTLRELDWEGYRARYGNIQRLDLILEAEGDSANRYKLAKQADVMMLFHLFSSEELRQLLERLGYPFEHETIPRNIAYYTGRASHGSTLCRVLYSWVLARSDRPRAMDLFAQALQSDVSDIQEGTTGEGVHLGASTVRFTSSSAAVPAHFA